MTPFELAFYFALAVGFITELTKRRKQPKAPEPQPLPDNVIPFPGRNECRTTRPTAS